MKNRLLIGLCLVLVQSGVIFAESTNEVKRGTYSYMAFLYYPDETVVENGARFFRSAVLIKPEWLISSAIDHATSEGFPMKTLLARAGAVTIDDKVTLNEDEDEQEREVIQIVRPTIHNLDMWYFTDITLLQTLLPFNMTSAVGLAPYSIKPRDNSEQKCFILVYARKYDNSTEDKELTQMSVELVVPANSDNCGTQFSESSMACALDTEETKSSFHDPNFCQGNAGGPLICDNEVIGLQTYINSICKTPHLYQLISSWSNLITCGTQKRCSQEYCSSACTTIDKDPPTTEMTVSHTTETSSEPIVTVETSEIPSSVEVSHSEAETTTATTSSSTTQSSSVSSESSTSSMSTTTTTHEPETSESTSTTTTTTPITTTKKRTKTTKLTTLRSARTTNKSTTAPTTVSSEATTTEIETPRETENPFTWHGEDKKTKTSELKVHDMESAAEEETESPRRANVQAQVSHVQARVSSVTHKSSAVRIMCLLKRLLVGLVILALVI